MTCAAFCVSTPMAFEGSKRGRGNDLRRRDHPPTRPQATSGGRPHCTSDGRSVSTAIYFLLAAAERSHWHRIDAVEIWHYYAGAPLSLSTYNGVDLAMLTLGPNLAAGELPQATVPHGAWQAAESLGAWTLCGCTVAPGFDFEKFELAAPGWSPPIQRSAR